MFTSYRDVGIIKSQRIIDYRLDEEMLSNQQHIMGARVKQRANHRILDEKKFCDKWRQASESLHGVVNSH